MDTPSERGERRAHVGIYYQPTLLKTGELLTGNSSSRSLKLFGLKSCGIGYTPFYTARLNRHLMASELLEDWKFDRIIKADNSNGDGYGSVDIFMGP